VVSVNDSMHSTHELEDGMMVTFKEVVGMTELNGTTHKVKGNQMCVRACVFVQCIDASLCDSNIFSDKL